MSKNFFNFIASMRFTVLLLGLFFALILFGTILQAELGLYWVVQHIFYAVPGLSLLLLFLINIAASLIRIFPTLGNPIPLSLAHIGLAILLLGLFGDAFASSYIIGIVEGETSDKLFYSDLWDIVLEAPEIQGIEADRPIDQRNRLGKLVQASRKLNKTRFKFEPEGYSEIIIEVEAFYPNAEVDLQDKTSILGYKPLNWEDSASANLPLLVGQLFIGGNGDQRNTDQANSAIPSNSAKTPNSAEASATSFAVWAGSSSGFEFPVVKNGRLEPMVLRLDPATLELPFRMTLEKFTADFYPNSEVPKFFQSRVSITDGDTTSHHEITLNNPLSYGGYVFYQDSYQFDDHGHAASIFTVRTAKSNFLPIAGTILSMLGFLIHYFLLKKPLKHFSLFHREQKKGTPRNLQMVMGIFFGLLLSIFAPHSIHAQDISLTQLLPQSISAFGSVGIGASGRIMPTGSYGEILLQKISGQRNIAGVSGAEFLFLSLFNLTGLENTPFIRIVDPSLQEILGINELRDATTTPNLSNRKQNNNQLFTLSEMLPFIERLSQLNQTLGEELTEGGNENRVNSLLSLYQESTELFENLRIVYNLASSFDLPPEFEAIEPDSSTRSISEDEDSSVEQLTITNNTLEELGLRVYPGYSHLVHPLSYEAGTKGRTLYTELLQLIEELALLTANPLAQSGSIGADANASAEYSELDLRLAMQFQELAKIQRDWERGLGLRIASENLYRKGRFFDLAGIALLFATLVLFFVESIGQKHKVLNISDQNLRLFALCGKSIALVGFALATTGFVLRIIITQRPPITDLYTSVLFVAWIILLLAHLVKQGGLAWILVLASALLFIASPKPIGDDLQQLQAVLNNNFLLIIHVVVIILGYSAVFLSSVFSHVCVLLYLRSSEHPQIRPLYRLTKRAMRFALILVFLGTLLGGFWAELSWGRFWGWDPKENAALLLILYLAIIVHLRPSGKHSDFTIAMLGSASILVLLFSWFAVNLIGRGLHSYGWDPTIGILYFLPSLAEFVFIAINFFRYRGIYNQTIDPNNTPKGNRGMEQEIISIQRFSGGKGEYIKLSLKPGSPSSPGESFTMRIRSAGQTIYRAYSAIDSSGSTFLIQIQRNGIASNFFAQEAKVGSRLELSSTGKNFMLIDPQFFGGKDSRSPAYSKRPEIEVFVATGIGISPILAMLRFRGEQTHASKLELLWAIRAGRDTFLIDELKEASKNCPNLRIQIQKTRRIKLADIISAITRHYVSSPVDSSVEQREADGDIRKTIEESAVYLCGSASFIDVLEAERKKCKKRGDPLPNFWKTEYFTPSQYRKERSDVAHSMLLRPSNRVIEVKAGQSLKEALNNAGECLAGTCHIGQCGECRCQLISGSVFMDEPNILGYSHTDSGDILTCCAFPESDIEIYIIAAHNKNLFRGSLVVPNQKKFDPSNPQNS